MLSPYANTQQIPLSTSNVWLQILGRGQLTKPLKFSAQAFSEVARAGIEKAGGSLEEASPSSVETCKGCSACSAVSQTCMSCPALQLMAARFWT